MKMYIVIKECELAPYETGYIDEIISYMNIEEAEYAAKKFNESCEGYPMMGSAIIYEFDRNNIKDLDQFVSKLKKVNNNEKQNAKHKNNGTDNTFFKYVADVMSRDYRNEEKPSTDNRRIDL